MLFAVYQYKDTPSGLSDLREQRQEGIGHPETCAKDRREADPRFDRGTCERSNGGVLVGICLSRCYGGAEAAESVPQRRSPPRDRG